MKNPQDSYIPITSARAFPRHLTFDFETFFFCHARVQIHHKYGNVGPVLEINKIYTRKIVND